VPARDGRLKAREFLFYTEDLALAALGDGGPRPERKVMWTILQFHWGQPAAHIELQPQVSRRVVELGLHFEGPAEWNEALACRVAAHAPELMAALGEGWELEEWTASWRRLHRTYPFEDHLTTALGREVAGGLATALRVLRPFAIAGAPPSRPPARATPRAGGRRRAARR
jgi:hypothetical protein